MKKVEESRGVGDSATKMHIFTGLLSPVFIASCKRWIRNIKPAQRISIFLERYSDGADPAEVLLSEETPRGNRCLWRRGEKTSWPQAGSDLLLQGINEALCFSRYGCRRKQRDDATQICLSLQRQGAS